MSDERTQLKEWVLANMTTEAVSQLDKWKEEVANLVELTATGQVLSKVEASRLDARDQVLLQFIGRAYAEAGGFVESSTITNPELERDIPVPPGTIGRVLLELRESHMLQQTKRGVHQIVPARVGEAVQAVRKSIDSRPEKAHG